MTYLYSNIRLLRRQKKINPARFAQLTGIKKDLSLIEAGKITLSPEELLAVSDVLNVSVDRLLRKDLAAIQQKLKNFSLGLLAMDVDGVLTDGGMYYTQGGDEFKKFDTKDGMAVIKLTESGIPAAILSTGINDRIIKDRAKRLNIQFVYIGTWTKLNILSKWCKELKIGLKNVAYIGDDINDLEVIRAVGLSACPADAVESVRSAVDIVLEKKGGMGCVREFVENFVDIH